jgi:hypothetical protein
MFSRKFFWSTHDCNFGFGQIILRHFSPLEGKSKKKQGRAANALPVSKAKRLRQLLRALFQAKVS